MTFFFKKTQRKADQIWNKYKLCQLLLSDRFTAHFTPSNIDDLSKKIFLPILKLFKKNFMFFLTHCTAANADMCSIFIILTSAQPLVLQAAMS